jgi:glycosyltransferase involved in cell wall biosynthesis
LERVVARYHDEIVYLKKLNGGLASARNAAIRRSSAPLIALLDADDIWEPEYLAVQAKISRGFSGSSGGLPERHFFWRGPS